MRHLNGRGKGESDYDYKHDILFFKTKDREYSKSLELNNIILDTDNEGFITGMQILDASNFLQVKPMILKNIKNFEFNAHNEHGKIEVRLTFQMQIRNKIVEKNPIILQETPMYLPSSTLQVSA